MRTVNMHEAKTHLSRLVEEAAGGEAFVIAKAGKPMVKVVPLEPEVPRKQQRLGFMKGQFKVPADFDTMYADEICRMFEGEDTNETPADDASNAGDRQR
ncbi:MULTISPECIES: type II toxin-antitoxin system Phd/YefM family antitoxin [unclassified Aureimonas]|uniref:type II toxin-antitoxin system Phd/YefM family antitoxin n=1 Tax=unclassified Aureimonas TaxID=2615206 RepID=UPI000701701F|nr:MULTISPECIES: type II toxin-antitoxin system prevent-host-death family antitoxin [unclassified Aureimonas]KQT55328.1 prevent-host-death protein [Aureimonas sp. Leaf427]KQT71119.1 prevent-host-death protein [Aureimonas sp. Leaf460]